MWDSFFLLASFLFALCSHEDRTHHVRLHVRRSSRLLRRGNSAPRAENLWDRSGLWYGGKRSLLKNIIQNLHNPGLRVLQFGRGVPELQQAREREVSKNIITAANPGLRVLSGISLTPHGVVDAMALRGAISREDQHPET